MVSKQKMKWDVLTAVIKLSQSNKPFTADEIAITAGYDKAETSHYIKWMLDERIVRRVLKKKGGSLYVFDGTTSKYTRKWILAICDDLGYERIDRYGRVKKD